MAKILDWNNYPDFEEHEFLCSCGCGRADMDPEFMFDLQLIRSSVDFLFRVSSGFRCPEYDERCNGADVHPSGHAADLLVFGGQVNDIVMLSELTRIKRFGFHQRGPREQRFIHLDSLIKEGHPSPWIWTY